MPPDARACLRGCLRVCVGEGAWVRAVAQPSCPLQCLSCVSTVLILCPYSAYPVSRPISSPLPPPSLLPLPTRGAQELNTFPFEVIKKWLPSNLRSRNPGPDNCLDLQIETDRGPRDLRMRTDSSAHVKAIIQALRETVEVRRALARKGGLWIESTFSVFVLVTLRGGEACRAWAGGGYVYVRMRACLPGWKLGQEYEGRQAARTAPAGLLLPRAQPCSAWLGDASQVFGPHGTRAAAASAPPQAIACACVHKAG